MNKIVRFPHFIRIWRRVRKTPTYEKPNIEGVVDYSFQTEFKSNMWITDYLTKPYSQSDVDINCLFLNINDGQAVKSYKKTALIAFDWSFDWLRKTAAGIDKIAT